MPGVGELAAEEEEEASPETPPAPTAAAAGPTTPPVGGVEHQRVGTDVVVDMSNTGQEELEVDALLQSGVESLASGVHTTFDIRVDIDGTPVGCRRNWVGGSLHETMSYKGWHGAAQRKRASIPSAFLPPPLRPPLLLLVLVNLRCTRRRQPESAWDSTSGRVRTIVLGA